MNRPFLNAALVAALATGAASAGPPARGAPSSLAEKVIAYAAAHEGQRVGGGQCTDLVNAALAAAGARQIQIVQTAPTLVAAGYPAQTYRWGAQIPLVTAEAKHALPGMVLQFEDCTFRKPDGTQTWSMPHHTAIVKSASGSVVTLLQQNAPAGGPVSETTLDLRWLQRTTADGKKALLTAYIPQAK